MLNNPAIHIDDIDRPIGSVHDLHGTETLIRRSEKFLTGYGRFPRDDAVLLREHDTLHEVGRWLRNEGIPLVGGAEEIAAVNHRAARRGGLRQRAVGAQGARVVTPVHARGRMNRKDRLISDDAAIDTRHIAQEWIARERASWEKIRAEEVGIVIVIQPTHIVLTKAILPAAQASPALPSAGVEAEAGTVASTPNAVVHRPGRRVGHMLRLTTAGAVVGRDDRPHIGNAGALGILTEK